MSEAADRLLDRKEKYEFHTPVFDGPLDLLLFLIKPIRIMRVSCFHIAEEAFRIMSSFCCMIQLIPKPT